MEHTAAGIRVRDRKNGVLFQEQVYGEGALQWVYGTPLGRALESSILSKRPVSSLMGAYHDSSWSTSKIPTFIKRYGIPMEEFESGPFSNFNEFFIRRFKPGARPFAAAPALAAFSEGRYFAWDKTTDTTAVPVKNALLSPRELLSDAVSEEQSRRLAGGPLLLARLCPTDYHRFHFPDSGQWISCRRVSGRLHSVNPVALTIRPRTFLDNERQVSILECDSLGLIAYVEVGALGVGKIVQSRISSGRFERGEEKGYFLFGGSTVIVIGEPGRWKPDSDLIQNTTEGFETLIRLGESLAR